MKSLIFVFIFPIIAQVQRQSRLTTVPRPASQVILGTQSEQEAQRTWRHSQWGQISGLLKLTHETHSLYPHKIVTPEGLFVQDSPLNFPTALVVQAITTTFSIIGDKDNSPRQYD